MIATNSLASQAGLKSTVYLTASAAIDATGFISVKGAENILATTFTFIVNASLRSFGVNLALDTASFALGKQKAFMDVAKWIIADAEAKGTVSYEKLKIAYYFYAASEKMGDIAYVAFDLILKNTNMSLTRAAIDTAVNQIPLVGNLWSGYMAGLDTGALLGDLTWALFAVSTPP